MECSKDITLGSADMSLHPSSAAVFFGDPSPPPICTDSERRSWIQVVDLEDKPKKHQLGWGGEGE